MYETLKSAFEHRSVTEYDRMSARDCNPAIPGFPNPGIPEILQSRNPGIEPDSIPGFRD